MVIEVQILKPASGFIKEIAAGGNTDECDANPSKRSVNMRGDGGANMGALIWIVVPTSPAFIPFIQKIVQKLIFNPFVRGKSAKNFFFNLISYHNSLHLSFYIAISIYFLGSVARLLFFVICLYSIFCRK